MKRTLLIGLALLAVGSTLIACGGGGGGGGTGGGGGGGTATTIAGSYRLVAIPLMAGNQNTAAKVNSAGQVVGTSGDPGGERAFYWDSTNGLVSLHGAGNPGDATSFGLGINSRGEASGRIVVPSFGYTRGFYALQGGGGFIGNVAFSSGNAINTNHIVVGSIGASEDTRTPHAIDTDSSASFSAVTGLAVDWSEFTDVNEAGDAVGVASLTAGGRLFSFVKQFNQVTNRHEAAGENQTFTGINNSRNVCGTRGTQAIFKSASTDPIVIGGLSGATLSEANDLSDGNIVVGFSNFGTLDRAFAWTQSQGMVNLQSRLDSSAAGWTLNKANGISNDGRICGEGTFNGTRRAFVLLPN